jgi:hypothetical protein
LSIGLKKHAKMMAVAVALSLVCLVVVRTGVAEAQHADGVNTDSSITESLFAPEPSERLEAYIGDSLRAISGREVGPRANPPHIATEAEQIFETNRHRLGDGSSLLMIPPVTEPATNPPGNDSENTPEAGEPAASASVEPAAEPAAVSETSEPVESPGKGFLLPPVTEPATNPPGNDSENTPEAGEPAASASVEPAAEPAAVSETSEPVESPGEGFLLPPVTEPATNPPGNDSENTLEAGEPAASASVEPAAEPVAVSETSEPVESAVGASSGIPKASWLNERRLVGLGVLVLTLVFTILLILWKMPMDRHVKRGMGNVRISEPPNPSESLYKLGESRTVGRTFSDPRDLRWVRRRASGKRAS